MSRLNVYLLGSPRIEIDGLPVKVDTRKAIALLAYIAITGQSHQRDSLVNLLWPEFDETRGRAVLRRNLYALRKALDGAFLSVDRGTIGLNPDAETWLDVEQFHSHLRQCLTHAHSASQCCPDCIPSLTAAVGLYRGDFLAGFSLRDSLNFDEWQFFQSDSLRREQASALERLTLCHTAQGAFDAAIDTARRWLALDRLNEDAHRQLILLYAWSGQRSAALRQYRECAKTLDDELGAPPQKATTLLYEAVLDGHAPRPPDIGDHARRQREEPIAPPAELLVSSEDAERLEARPADIAIGSSVRPPGQIGRNIFVARERELKRLFGYLDAALAGRGRVVFVTGGAGRGKTELIQEFARRAKERVADLVYAFGHCNAHTGIGDPYLPFREMFGLLTGDIDALWEARAITQEHARRLWDTFPCVVDALVDVGPDLIGTIVPGPPLVRRAAAYLSGGLGDRPAWQTRLEKLVERKVAFPHDLNLQQGALFGQVARVMQALARQRPLLLAVDDLQWADVGSISLLFHLGRGVANNRILIVGAYRPDEVALGRPLAHSEPVRSALRQAQDEPILEDRDRHPLDFVLHEFQRAFGEITIDLAQAEDRRFVEEYLDAEPNQLNAEFRETLFRQTRGHPLFTVELLHGMQERGDLVQDDNGRWVEGPSLNWEILPARAEAVIAERVGRLDRASIDVLRVASVEGETFTAEVVALVRCADERETVQQLSGELVRRHHLVRAQEMQRLGARRLSRYRFRHDLYQNYLYQSLDPVERAHLHEAVGTALETLYGDETEDIAVSLARHYQEAGVVEKAIDYLYQAGERAKRMSANAEAIAHLSQALDLLKSVPDTPQRTRRELDLQVALGVPLVLVKGHAAPEVQCTYARARELSASIGDNQKLFHVLLGLRRYYLHCGGLRTARELGEQLIILGTEMHDSSHVVGTLYLSRAHFMQSEVFYCLGEFLSAREHGQEGGRIYAPQQRDKHVLLYGNDTGICCGVQEAMALWQLGWPNQAIERVQAGLQVARELSHPFTLAFVLCFATTIHQLCRDVETVQEQVGELLHISEKHGFALFQALGTVLQGWTLSEKRSIQRSDSGLHGDARRPMDVYMQSDAADRVSAGIAALRAIGVQRTLPKSLAFLAEANGRAGKIKEGLDRVHEAREWVEKTDERTYDAELFRLEGELLLLGQGDGEEAEACFLHALEVARCQSAKSWELRAAMSLSRLWQQQGKTAAALALLQEVYEWFTEGFDTSDLKDARTLLEELD